MVNTQPGTSFSSTAHPTNAAATDARFRVMADVSPVMIWVHDASGRLQFVNKAYCEFFGVNEADVLGPGWQGLVHPADIDAYLEGFLRSVETHTAWRATVRVRRHDGEWRWIESFSAPWFTDDGTYAGAVGSSPDITEIIEARAQAEAANKSRDEAIAMISHELRTPLTVISGWVSMLSNGGGDPESLSLAIEHLKAGTRVLHKLVDDLLDLARVTGGRLSIDAGPVNLLDVVNACVGMHSADARNKGVHLAFDRPPMPVILHGDLQRLQQVVSNLLTNAIKFTPGGGTVTVTVAETDASAVITMADTGSGISQEFLPRIFDRFAQQERGGGLGLGLAIARQIVELHGGTIRASSGGRGLGATFEVKLPALA